jgi:outer membrane lipoprotein SlyB
MSLIKKILILSIVIFTTTLLGCTTTSYHKGDGIVIAEKKIGSKNFLPHDNTQTGAKIGGTIGAIGGAACGGLIGLLFGVVNPAAVLVTVPAFGAIGAAYFGGAGALMGSGLGYATDLASPNAGTYQFIVKPEDSEKTITITQYNNTLIPVNTSVHILEKDHITYIIK